MEVSQLVLDEHLAPGDVLHFPFDAADDHPVADGRVLGERDQKTADEIADRRLRAQGQRDASDAQSAPQRSRVDAQAQSEHECDRDDPDGDAQDVVEDGAGDAPIACGEDDLAHEPDEHMSEDGGSSDEESRPDDDAEPAPGGVQDGRFDIQGTHL